jgi:pimeloyl-ACP methyl ester carboxylesterase
MQPCRNNRAVFVRLSQRIISNGSSSAFVLTVAGAAATLVVVRQQALDRNSYSTSNAELCATEATTRCNNSAVKNTKYNLYQYSTTGRYQSSKLWSGTTMATTRRQPRATALNVCGRTEQLSVSRVRNDGVTPRITACSSSSQECETLAALDEQQSQLSNHVESWTRAAYWAWWSYSPSELEARHCPHESSATTTDTDTTTATTTLHSSDSTALRVPWASGTCRLLYAQETSAPWMPAHFLVVAVNEDDQNQVPDDDDDDALHVLLVIRGTSSWAELLWTALLGTCGSYGEECPPRHIEVTEPFVYNGMVHGRVHSYFMECGRALVQLHHDRLVQLCRALGKTHVRITCVGHSLGGAVAVTAGLEWNQKMHDVASRGGNDSRDGAALPRICVDQVIALGCPPCLSPNVAQACADFVTTLIHQDDMVPRWNMTAVAELVPQLLSAAIVSVDNDPLSLLLAALAWGTNMEDIDPASPWPSVSAAPSAPARLLLLLQWMNQQSKVLLDHPQQDIEAVLLPPGRCIQLQSSDPTDGSTTVVSARRVPNSYYVQIRLSPSMLTGT